MAELMENKYDCTIALDQRNCAKPHFFVESESERMFSKLTEIYSPKRNQLSLEHAKQQLFLYFNY
jgi:hypothetical protein